MKILQLIDTLSLGGAERMCVNISNSLADTAKVYICAARKGGILFSLIDPRIRYYELRKRHALDFGAFRRLIKIIRQDKYNIIHAHSSSVFWAVLAKFFAPGVNVIWHDHFGQRLSNRRGIIFYRIFSHRIDAIITANEELKVWSLKNMRVDPSRVIYINNFPMMAEIVKNPISEQYKIVCLANFRPQKDHSTLIEAISMLKNRNMAQPFKVLLAGAYNDNKYLKKIKSLIIDKGLSGIVEIVGPVGDTEKLLSDADCGVLSSIGEGLPVSLLEYGMAGLPVVVTDVGQCAEVVGNGRYGKLVESRRPDLLSDALYSIMTNLDASKKMGEEFKKQVETFYGPESFKAKYIDLIMALSV